MYPVIDLGKIKIPSYVILIIIGMIGYTITTINLLEKKEKYKMKTTNKLLILSIFSFIILYFTAFIMNSLFHSIEKGEIVIGGITWLGGVILTFPITIYLIHKYIPELRGKAINTFSLMIPGIVLAHGFGRIGCFLGGCCFGEVTNLGLGVVFPEGSPAAKMYPAPDGNSLSIIPTQLYEAIFEFVLFIIMIATLKKNKYKNIEIYGIAYGVFRFILEFFRGDDRGTTGLYLSPSQLMSIILIIIALLIILYKKGKIFKKITLKIESKMNDNKQKFDDEVINKLEECFELVKKGILTEDEYQKIKEKIINDI